MTRMMNLQFCVFGFLYFSAIYCQQLESYNIDTSDITVSGISSGGAMVVQFHVAYSKNLIGAGVVAGIPYWCAQDTLSIALTACTEDPSLILLPTLWGATDFAYSLGTIDDPSYLKNDRIWLFSGMEDSVVRPGVMKSLQKYYQHYIPSNQIESHLLSQILNKTRLNPSVPSKDENVNKDTFKNIDTEFNKKLSLKSYHTKSVNTLRLNSER